MVNIMISNIIFWAMAILIFINGIYWSFIHEKKISVYFAGLAIMITLWSSLNETQRDISDLKERIAILETKVDEREK